MWIFKNKHTHTGTETPLQKTVRLLLIGILFGGMLWGFRMNNAAEVTGQEGESRPAPHAPGVPPSPDSPRAPDGRHPLDATRTLTEEQEADLALFIDKFFTAYGVPLAVRISAVPLPDDGSRHPEAQSGGVFLGLCPAARQVVFHAPPLVRNALGEDTVRYLAHEHFLPYYADGNWPEGLAAALNLIIEHLDKTITP